MLDYHTIEKETAAARDSHVSQSSLRIIDTFIPRPKLIRGKYIFDMGAGVSTLAQELTGLGAYAVGIDYRYTNLRELRRAGEHVFTMAIATDPSIPPKVKKVAEMEFENFFLSANHKKRPNRPFIAALAGNLPFADDSFHYGYSNVFIGSCVFDERFIREGIRVLKPGGTFFIQPWPNERNNAIHSKDNINWASEVLLHLEQDKIPFKFWTTSEPGRNVLSITKPV